MCAFTGYLESRTCGLETGTTGNCESVFFLGLFVHPCPLTLLLCVREESKSARCHKRSSPHNAEGFFGSFIWCRRGGKTTVGRLFLIPADQNVLDGQRGSEEASLLAGSWNSGIFSAQSESVVGMICTFQRLCATH